MKLAAGILFKITIQLLLVLVSGAFGPIFAKRDRRALSVSMLTVGILLAGVALFLGAGGWALLVLAATPTLVLIVGSIVEARLQAGKLPIAGTGALGSHDTQDHL